jgi:dTDP-4-dehydrorhamnose 3,5-epimerase
VPTIERLDVPDVLLIHPAIHGDERGFFMESWNKIAFATATGVEADFVQDNHSRSARGVLRGLHYQLPPHAQGKLVRVVAGAAFDVAVDIRRSSSTFRHWVGAELSADNATQLWVPPGVAHGFLVLSDHADVLYKTTDVYAPDCDRALRWDDPEIGIAWPLEGAAPILSDKDRNAPHLPAAELFD